MSNDNSNIIKDFFNEKAFTWDETTKHNFLLIEQLIDKIDFNEADKILDVGCGTGILEPFLLNKSISKITAIDISENMIKIAKSKIKNINFICADFYTFNCSDKFDKIIFFDSYPHFIDKRKLLDMILLHTNIDSEVIIIHDIGKERLKKVHSEHVNISKELLNIQKEFSIFKSNFSLIKNEDEIDHYLMIIKRNI